MARQLIKQLPAVFQTETLKKFSIPPIDQVFQPGESESLAGYIVPNHLITTLIKILYSQK